MFLAYLIYYSRSEAICPERFGYLPERVRLFYRADVAIMSLYAPPPSILSDG